MKRKDERPDRKAVWEGNYDKDHLLGNYADILIADSSVKDFVSRGASGGVGTTLLWYLLSQKEVDLVIGVGFSASDPTVPAYRVIGNPDHITELSGSKYVYMEVGPLIKLLEDSKDKKTAVFVQPCHIKAMRRYQKTRYPQLKYIFSFFCGYNIEYQATDYLIKKTNIPKPSIAKLSYRGGDYPGGFEVTTFTGAVKSFGKECFELVDLIFLRKGCKICPLYAGEGADIILGDAWIKGEKNKTIVMIRSPNLTQKLNELERLNFLATYQIKESDLVKMHWHNFSFKKYGLKPLIQLLQSIFSSSLVIRIAPFRLLTSVSRIRRQLSIGIPIQLKKRMVQDEFPRKSDDL